MSNLNLLPEMLAARFPGCVFTVRSGKLEWHAGNPTALPEMPVLLEMLGEYEAEIAELEAAKNRERNAGVSVLITSLGDPDYDRPLEPAKVRLALALIVKQLATKEPLSLTEQESAALDRGIANLFAHLLS